MNSRDELEKRLTDLGKAWDKQESFAEHVMSRISESSDRKVHPGSAWTGGLTVKQQLTFGGLSLTVLAVVVLIFCFAIESTDLMANVADNIRNAKSYSYEMVVEAKLPGGKTHKMSQSIQFQSPGSYLMEGELPRLGKQTRIFHKNKDGIEINHKQKTFEKLPPFRGAMSQLMMLEKIGEFQGKAKRQLDTKEVDGVQAIGFVVNTRDVDPDIHDGEVEVWINTKTRLPVLIVTTDAIRGMKMHMQNFEWNVEFAADTFSAVPPNGFSEKQLPKRDPQEQLAKIKEALTHFAELSGGHYPKVTIVYGDVTRDKMLNMAGFQGQLDPKWFKDEKYQKIVGVTGGLAAINSIQRENEETAYHGKTVGPKDQGKVLFHWKLADGSHQVLYGDLKDEVVSAKQLKQLK